MASRSTAPVTPPARDDDAGRLAVDVHLRPGQGSTLARDVREGLSRAPYRLPPKHFYDDEGSRLFDAICDTPEYYLTRAEAALLARAAPAIVATAGAAELVELGSGAAKKTRALLDAIAHVSPSPRYVPFDVSESMLRESAIALLADYPTLRVHGVVGDYERHLGALPRGGRRLVAFLGSTVGNLEPVDADAFLAGVARALTPGDHFLLGVDLVKDPAVIELAYNDAAGLTAAFNRNVLAVINRQLGGDFDPSAFEHRAFFDPAKSRIEMHLIARRAHTARVRALDMEVPFEVGAGIHTEISRKFTRSEAEELLARAGMKPCRWDEAPGGAFGLALARVGG